MIIFLSELTCENDHKEEKQLFVSFVTCRPLSAEVFVIVFYVPFVIYGALLVETLITLCRKIGLLICLRKLNL